jgi:uncharacterized membrane protein
VKEILDIVVLIAFVGFMVYIFGGYHSNKRQQEKEREERENKK